MALSKKTRGLVLSIALALTLAVIFFAPPPDSTAKDISEPIHLTKKPSGNSEATNEIPEIVITRNSDPSTYGDPFASMRQENVAPLNEAEVIKPAEPAAPPAIPYSYVGKLVEDGKTKAFLSKQDNNYSVKVGDTLDDLYRVDELNEQSLVLTYLPLDLRQTINIRSEN